MTPPIRTCLGCRARLAKSQLVRLAWNTPAGAVVVDTEQVLPGRGCYLHAGCADLVARRKQVGRALRRPVDSGQAAAVLATLSAVTTQRPA